MTPIIIALPWPDAALSPNSRAAWQAKLNPKKTARDHGFYQAQECDGEDLRGRDLALLVTFCPPDKRHRDLDNLYSQLKPAQDGVCLGLNIDDKSIRRVTLEWGYVTEGGAVFMQLEALR